MGYEDSKTERKAIALKDFGVALVLHVVLIALACCIGACTRRPPKESFIPIDMTVVPPDAEVVKENPDPRPVEPKPKPQPKEEPKVKPPPEPEVKETVKQDAVIKEKPKKKEFKKGKLKKAPPKKKEFKKSELKKSSEPERKNPTALEKPKSAAEIAKLLAAGAKFGAKNQLPANETQRCVSMLAAAIRREWDRESFQWYPGLVPVKVTLKLGTGGRVLGWNIERGSGDAEVDRTVRNALARLKSVPGLSSDFISNYSTLTIEMEPTR